MHTRYSQTKERKLLKIIINIFKEIREDYISMKLESHAKGKIRELIKILIGGQENKTRQISQKVSQGERRKPEGGDAQRCNTESFFRIEEHESLEKKGPRSEERLTKFPQCEISKHQDKENVVQQQYTCQAIMQLCLSNSEGKLFSTKNCIPSLSIKCKIKLNQSNT